MIYFENHYKGIAGFNNHLIPYTFCISLSNFLERDFYFDYEVPPSTPPEFAVNGSLKDKFAVLLTSPRAVVSDLLTIPERRQFDRPVIGSNTMRIENSWLVGMTDEATLGRYGPTGIIDFFSIGREMLVKEKLQDFQFIEFGDKTLVNASFFYFLNRTEKDKLLTSIKLSFIDDVEALASKIISQLGQFHAIHLRLGDFVRSYAADGYRVDVAIFRRYIERMFSESDLPLVVATDGLDEKNLLGDILPLERCVFVDELIFGSFEDDFRRLQFTDYSVLILLNQIICAAGDLFVGTCRSTVTSIIHRLRQERYGRKDFKFFPDERVSRALNDKMELTPDCRGFFEWNRYTPFNEYHEYPAWMREWDYDLTSL